MFIYIETATRIATQELPPGVGLLGEAISSLYALFGEIRCSAAISMRPTTVRMGIRHRGNGMIVAA